MIRETLTGANPDLLFADGFDDCILGLANRCGSETVVAYSTEKILAKLAKEMPHENAVEYFEFNIAGAFVGKFTPVFMTDISIVKSLLLG